jgi:hypothetical protein
VNKSVHIIVVGATRLLGKFRQPAVNIVETIFIALTIGR